VYNLSKSLNAKAEPCAKQGTQDIILENPNGETNMENLLSWLVTVHNITRMREETVTVDSAQRKLPNYLRPPVFIVGTHADKPVEDIATMKSQIWKKMSHKGYAKHVVQPFFSIDNTVRSLQKESGFHGKEHNIEQKRNIDDIQELQNKIMKVFDQEPYRKERIPVRWLHFEKNITSNKRGTLMTFKNFKTKS